MYCIYIYIYIHIVTTTGIYSWCHFQAMHISLLAVDQIDGNLRVPWPRWFWIPIADHKKVQRWTISSICMRLMMTNVCGCLQSLLKRGGLQVHEMKRKNSEALRGQRKFEHSKYGLPEAPGTGELNPRPRPGSVWNGEKSIFFESHVEKAADAPMYMVMNPKSSLSSLSHSVWSLREWLGLRFRQQLSLSLWDWPMGLNVTLGNLGNASSSGQRR